MVSGRIFKYFSSRQEDTEKEQYNNWYKTRSNVYGYDPINYAELYHCFQIVNFILFNENYFFHRISVIKQRVIINHNYSSLL